MTKATQKATSNTGKQIDIHKLALAILLNDTKNQTIQADIMSLVAVITKDTLQPERATRGDEVYSDAYLANSLTALVADIKDSGKNPAQTKRAIDDTAKRVQRASETIDKACSESDQDSPFRDANDKLRRMTISKGTKKAPTVCVKFMAAKQDVTLESYTKNVIAYLQKNDIKTDAFLLEFDKQIDAAKTK